MRYPQVVQSLIFNNSLKVKINGHTRPQVVQKLLLQVSVKEFHNILVSDPDNGRLKDAIDAEKNIIIRNSKLRSLLPSQLLKMSPR